MSIENRMIKIETQLVSIIKKLDNVPTVSEMDLANEKLIERVLKSCDERYASKLVEKVVYGLVGAVLLAVIGGVLALVIK